MSETLADEDPFAFVAENTLGLHRSMGPVLRAVTEAPTAEEREAAAQRITLAANIGAQRPETRARGPEACRRCDSSVCPGDCGKVRLKGFTMPELAAHRFTPRRGLLYRDDVAIARGGHIIQIVAPRGIGKTFMLDTFGLGLAAGIGVLGLRVLESFHVLNVDGELDSEDKQGRLVRLCDQLGIDFPENLTIVAADWQESYLPRVDTIEGQEALEPFVERADVIILDNRSCLVDAEGEKDASAWQPAQDYLLSLRRRGKCVFVGHHANRQGAARGHSKAEDMMNLILELSRPEGYSADQGARFNVKFTKTRGFHGAAAAPFVAALTSDGWVIESADTEEDNATRKLRAYLKVADEIGERPKNASVAVSKAGVNRAAGLQAWAALLKAGAIREHQQGGYCLA